MNTQQIKSSIWKATLSSYALVIGRMLAGLVSFRLLFQELNAEQFGFWSLLWSVFGYGILLDFGFGYAAQKRVAELSVRQDWSGLSRVLSSIFFFYLVSAAVLVALACLLANPLLSLFKVSASNQESFRWALVIFFAGMGLAFPLGIFPEVLRGQQRVALANQVTLAGVLLNLVLLVCAIYWHWGFLAILSIALGCVILPDIAAMLLALRQMPAVRIGWRFFSVRDVIETSRFSVYTYLNTLSNLLRNKTDQLIIASVLSVSAVTPYQAGAKVGELFNLFTRQLSEALSPASAHLHAAGQKAALREMLVSGMRFSILAALPLYVLCAFYLEGLVRLLTGIQHPARETLWIGQLLLFWYFSLVLTHLVFKRMFMMAGQEKRLMRQGVTEALLNIGLSLALTYGLKSAIGVALGSIIPTVLMGWVWLWRWAAREAGLSYGQLLERVLARNVLGCVPMLILALALRWQPYWTSGSTTWRVLLESSLLGVVALAGLWSVALSPAERRLLLDKVSRRLPTPLLLYVRPSALSR